MRTTKIPTTTMRVLMRRIMRTVTTTTLAMMMIGWRRQSHNQRRRSPAWKQRSYRHVPWRDGDVLVSSWRYPRGIPYEQCGQRSQFLASRLMVVDRRRPLQHQQWMMDHHSKEEYKRQRWHQHHKEWTWLLDFVLIYYCLLWRNRR